VITAFLQSAKHDDNLKMYFRRFVSQLALQFTTGHLIAGLSKMVRKTKGNLPPLKTGTKMNVYESFQIFSQAHRRASGAEICAGGR